MAISEANIKRKNELEDITNTNTNYNKKLKQMHYYKRRKLQQRSPSPLAEDEQQDDDDLVNCTSSRSSSRNGSNNSSPKKEYKSVSFDCPLLTPKEEDYYNQLDEDPGVASNTPIKLESSDALCNDRNDNEKFGVSTGTISNVDNVAVAAAAAATTTNNVPSAPSAPSVPSVRSDPSDCSDPSNTNLNTNPDYIVLTSSLRLLSNNRHDILHDIEHLSSLLDTIKSTDNQEEFLDFFNKLIHNDLNLPKQHKILKAPIINFNKYNLVHNMSCPITSNEELNKSNDKPLFKTLNLFGNNH